MIPMETQTEKGLKYFSYGFILYIIAMAVLLLVLLAIIGTVSAIIEDPENVDEEDVAPLMGFVGGLCLGILFIFIALILFLVGLISIYKGRIEFGDRHAASVQKGTIFLIVGFVINIVGSIAGGIGTQVVGIVVSIFIGLGLVYLILEIADEKGKNIIWIAGILYILIGIVASIVTIWLFTTYGLYDLTVEDEAAAEDAMQSVMPVMMISMGIGSLGLIPIIIFYLAFRNAYLRIQRREIQPIPASYPMPYGMPQYPSPYPYQPYQQYPQYPPPYGPPQQPPGYPPEVKTKTPEEIVAKLPITGKAQQPVPVIPAQAGIMECKFCKTQIPENSTTCPVCKKELK